MDLDQEVTDLRELIQRLQKEISLLRSENSRLQELNTLLKYKLEGILSESTDGSN